MIDFEYAKDKVMMGPERKSMIMTEEEKRNTAYHEGGHALVAAILPDADPVHKVTIIPRGRALGVTMQLPAEDKYSHTKEYLEATITVMMGGRIAEEKFLGHMTTGAGNDIERATDMARKMVCEWGMSEMGPLTFGRPEQEIFLGRDFGRTQDYSESTANQIDAEVKRIVTASYDRAKKLIDDNEKAMHRIARTLLEKEVLDGDEVLQIIAEESGMDVSKLRKTGPPKPPILPGRDPRDRGRQHRAAGARAGVSGNPNAANPGPRRRRIACMSIAESLLPEFDVEMASTRRLLERVPADRLDWKPHGKSKSLGELATHVTELARWGLRFEKDELPGRQRDGAGH